MSNKGEQPKQEVASLAGFVGELKKLDDSTRAERLRQWVNSFRAKESNASPKPAFRLTEEVEEENLAVSFPKTPARREYTLGYIGEGDNELLVKKIVTTDTSTAVQMHNLEIDLEHGHDYAGSMDWQFEQGNDRAENHHREVDEEYRGRGLFKAMLRLSEQALKKAGVKKMVAYSNKPATVCAFIQQGYGMPEEFCREDVLEEIKKNHDNFDKFFVTLITENREVYLTKEI